MEMVTVATFNDPQPADPPKRRLQEAGIQAEIHDERKLQKYWFMSETLAGIRLRVDKHNYERARGLLADWDKADGVLREAIHCPECGSSRVEYPQFTRKFVSPSLYAVLCKLGFFEKRFYCQECHYTWAVRQKVQSETDLLGWPKK